MDEIEKKKFLIIFHKKRTSLVYENIIKMTRTNERKVNETKQKT